MHLSTYGVFYLPFLDSFLNEQRNNLPVNSGYEMLEEDSTTDNDLINKVQENIAVKKHTRFDMLTYLSAKEYINTHHPKVVFLGFGETDESAHAGRYDAYFATGNNGR